MSESFFSPTQAFLSQSPPPPPCPPPPPPPLPPTPRPIAVYKCLPILKIFLEGLYDEGSNLAKLRGCQHVIQLIWTEVREYYKLAIIPFGKGINIFIYLFI